MVSASIQADRERMRRAARWRVSIQSDRERMRRAARRKPNKHNHAFGEAKYMDPDLYRATKNGNLECFKQAIEDGESFMINQVSPQGNTILHIASCFGHNELVELILARSHDLLIKKKNSKGNLAIHVAACAGHLSVVRSLLHFTQNNPGSCSGNELIKLDDEMIKDTNKEGNTALHMALIYHRIKVARYLLESYSTVSLLLNEEGVSPLYIAAEAGNFNLVKLMIENPAGIISEDLRLKAKSIVNGAIRGRNKDVLHALLSKEPTLIHSMDEDGNTPLSYATSVGYIEGVDYLLEKSTVELYQMDRNGLFPIHVASSTGRVDLIQKFLQRYPDLVELLNVEGQNILHIASKSGKLDVVTFILKTRELESLINEKDEQGDTPLHLATTYWHPKIVSRMTWDDRVRLNIVNNKGLTALDAAEEFMENFSFRKMLTWIALRQAGASVSQNPRNTKENEFSVPSNEPTKMVSYKDRVNTLLLVATLVATVTFAAGFTMPGGSNSSNSHLGMATLLMQRSFHLFLICDAIALYSSIVVVVALVWAQIGDLNLVLSALKLAIPLLGVSLTMMSLAFMAGVSLVVSDLNWLANVVWIMGSMFLAIFTLLFMTLVVPSSSNYLLTRYLFYCPFQLILVATGSNSHVEL